MLASGGARHRALTWNVCVAVAVLLVASGIVLIASGARADSTSDLVRLANQARSADNLAPLSVSTDLAAAARRQAARMASSGTLSHTANLGGVICCWSALGENVGMASSVDAVHSALMASPQHRANILSASYTQIGVGVVTDAHGTLWVSEIFRQPNGQAVAPPPPPAPAAAPAPAAPRRPAPPPARTTRAPAPPAAKTAAAPPPPTPAMATATTGGRLSRDLPGGRLAPNEATRFAATLADEAALGVDPVSRLLGFVAATAG